MIHSLRSDPIAVQAQEEYKLNPFMETFCNLLVNEYKNLKADYRKLMNVSFFKSLVNVFIVLYVVILKI